MNKNWDTISICKQLSETSLKHKTLRIRIKCLFIPKAICASSNSILCSLYLLSVFQQLAYTLNAFCYVTKNYYATRKIRWCATYGDSVFISQFWRRITNYYSNWTFYETKLLPRFVPERKSQTTCYMTRLQLYHLLDPK